MEVHETYTYVMHNMDITKLKIPKDYVVEREAVYNGYQMIVRFPNGYAASLVNHDQDGRLLSAALIMIFVILFLFAVHVVVYQT